MDCKILGEAKVVSLGDNNLYDDNLIDVQKGAPLGIAVVNVIYWYENYGYDGVGTIVYQDSCDRWHIDGLNHCSCSGPCDGFCNTSYSLTEIKKLLKKEDYYENGGKEILTYLDNEEEKEDTMSEKITRTATITVDLSQFTKAVMAICAMVEAAIERYDDTATSFNEELLALGNEMKTHAGHIYTVAIESSKTVLLTTKIRIKSEIDKLDSLIDAFEQVTKKQSNNKKGVDDEER